MNYPWRVAIIVPLASREAAEQAARAINSTGSDYVGEAFNVPLSATGSEPPTHFGLCTSATDEMVAQMGATLPQISGVLFWRCNAGGMLVASNVTQGQQQWDWNDSVSSAGLRPVSRPFG